MIVDADPSPCLRSCPPHQARRDRLDYSSAPHFFTLLFVLPLFYFISSYLCYNSVTTPSISKIAVLSRQELSLVLTHRRVLEKRSNFFNAPLDDNSLFRLPANACWDTIHLILPSSCVTDFHSEADFVSFTPIRFCDPIGPRTDDSTHRTSIDDFSFPETH